MNKNVIICHLVFWCKLLLPILSRELIRVRLMDRRKWLFSYQISFLMGVSLCQPMHLLKLQNDSSAAFGVQAPCGGGSGSGLLL